MTADSIVLKNITKHFGEKKVLTDISLTLPAGKIACLMGRSGTGKTTLLNILLGIYQQDGGTITGLPEKKAAVFQEDRLFEDFTVTANLTAVTGKSAEEVNAVLMKLLPCGTGKVKAKVLSGGMKRRAAIARALLSDYDFLIMDEPFKGLDEETRKVTADLILKMNAGRTAVMVSHDRAEAELLHAEILDLDQLM